MNRTIKKQDGVVNNIFVKMMEALGYDIELVYVKRDKLLLMEAAVIYQDNATNLPGYKKKSFLLYYNGGEIWFEHLDGIYTNEELVLEKLASDVSKFTRPSSTSYICFVFDETTVSDNIIAAVVNAILQTQKSFMKIAFCGLDGKYKGKFKKALSHHGFGMGFFDGLEDAKQWLLP